MIGHIIYPFILCHCILLFVFSTVTLSIAAEYSFRVSVQKTLGAEDDPKLTTLLDARWTKVEGKGTSVEWKTLHGFTFADKFYGLVASLS